MKKEMKKFLAAALICAMSIGLLSGCTGKSDSGSGESADAPKTQEEASAPEETGSAAEQQAPEETQADDNPCGYLLCRVGSVGTGIQGSD